MLFVHKVRLQEAQKSGEVRGLYRTADLGGSAKTKEFTKAIIASLPKNVPADASKIAPGSLYGGTHAGTAPAPASKRSQSPMLVRGVDIFVQSPGGALPKIPENVGRLKLSFKSNRGQKVWPGPLPEARMVDLYRCRYISPEGSPTLTDAEVAEVQAGVGKTHTWGHLEKLLEQDGKAMYSKAHGD